MKPVVISSSHLGHDGDDLVLATTPEDLDLIAYVILCNDYEGYLHGPPEPPTPPEIFETLPDGRLKDHARWIWTQHEKECENYQKVLADNSGIFQKISSREVSGCWDLMPKYMARVERLHHPLNFLEEFEACEPRDVVYSHPGLREG